MSKGSSSAGGEVAPASKPANADLFEEPDIFIPGPANAQPPAAPATKKTEDDDDDNDNDNENDGQGGGGVSDSYANLAARFQQLQK